MECHHAVPNQTAVHQTMLGQTKACTAKSSGTDKGKNTAGLKLTDIILFFLDII
jgi:hypothetical protein